MRARDLRWALVGGALGVVVPAACANPHYVTGSSTSTTSASGGASSTGSTSTTSASSTSTTSSSSGAGDAGACSEDGDCAGGEFCWVGACVHLTAVAAANASCALTSRGGVQCWGIDGDGQLGDGIALVDGGMTQRDLPVAVQGLSSVGAISAGMDHACALTTAGGVVCWGSNNKGELGNDTTIDSSVPVPVAGLASGVAAIAAGGIHTCALTTGGAVVCWGRNDNGELGTGDTNERHIPTGVVGLGSGVSAIAAGGFHTCALTTGGGVRCWGANYDDQLGNGGSLADGGGIDSNVPVPVSTLSTGVTAIAAGGYHTCALLSGGQAQCWGWNKNGQLGNDTTTDSSVPVSVVFTAPTSVQSLAAGLYHTCAVTTAGGAQCWGANYDGQLGTGDTMERHQPFDVLGLTSGVSAVAPGSLQTCALIAPGRVQCWGDNTTGELGTDAGTSSWIPLSVVEP
jgi:alpha-tubulin suppressor-like RCC1 family protein